MSNFDLAARFFLQLVTILTTCHGVSVLTRRLRQPHVVSEMIAGVILGPSVFGLLFPDAQEYFFPAESKPVLYVISHLGIVLYMFLVGLEFRTDLFRSCLLGATVVSIAGMVLPFVLGVLIALWLMQSPGEFFPTPVTPLQGSLFLGAAMCITAFPTLARIISERGLGGTSLGTLTLAAGAMADAGAWCLLAVVISSFESNANLAIMAIGGGAAYAVLTLTVGRHWLCSLEQISERQGKVTPVVMSFVILLLMCSSWLTDAIGIYSIFGAFILGCAMPRPLFARELVSQLGPLTSGVLVPLFFVYSGLNTQLGSLNTPSLWGVAVIVLAVSCFGKGFGCWSAARIIGEDQRSSLGIGILMNARGLMELIILNIGLDRDLITPSLFSIMVVMAIVTTLMTTPLLELIRCGRFCRYEIPVVPPAR